MMDVLGILLQSKGREKMNNKLTSRIPYILFSAILFLSLLLISFDVYAQNADTGTRVSSMVSFKSDEMILVDTVPSGFNRILSDTGVILYKKDYLGGQPDYVQVVSLSQGASVVLINGNIGNPDLGGGLYNEKNPSFYVNSLDTYWTSFLGSNSAAFCIMNGEFFSPNPNPTPLAFPLKVNGNIISGGYGDPNFSTDELLMLEIWNNHLDIHPLTSNNLHSSSAPNILGGLSENANKNMTSSVGRTFVGIDDTNNDGTFETVLFFNSAASTQASASQILRDFGADKIIMFDGGSSTQLKCQNKTYIPSTRSIPQTIGILKANTTNSGNVGGRILNVSGQPVNGATVFATSGGTTSITSSDGNFILEHVPAGSATIKASQSSDGSGQKTVNVVAYQDQQIGDITLYPICYPSNLSRTDNFNSIGQDPCNIPTPTVQPPPPATGWNESFFSDTNLSSQCGSRNETDVYVFRDSDGGWSPPSGCPGTTSAWSVRMERNDAWFDGGTYEFGLFYDDNARLYVDNILAVDGWNATQHYESRNITRGNHQLRLEYKNNAGHAIVQLWWRGPGALPPNGQTQDPNQWWVNYWGNQSQWQDAVGSENEGTGFLNHDWSNGGPGFGIPSDHFSLRFERSLYFACGTYRFHLSSDDGSRLSIDEEVIPAFDHWITNTWDTTADINLAAGNHTFRVDYFENGGGARVSFDWTPVSSCPPGSFSKINPTNSATDQPTSLMLQWEASNNATSYEYCYDTTNDNNCNWINNGTTLIKVLSGLEPGKTYYWHVRAMGSNGMITYSNNGATDFWSFTTAGSNSSQLSLQLGSTLKNWPITIELRYPLLDPALPSAFTYSATTDANGNLSNFPLTGASPGTTYNLLVKPKSWLRKQQQLTLVTGLNSIDFQSSFIAGDINGDNRINILDFTLLSNAFGTANSAADLNGDGTVNILDFTLLSNGFGNFGDGGEIILSGASSALAASNIASGQLTLVPSNKTPKVGDIITLDLNFDTNTLPMAALEAMIDYDQCVLQPLPNQITHSGIFVTTAVVDTPGTLDYEAHKWSGVTPGPSVSGAGNVASIPFKVIASVPSTSLGIRFRSGSTYLSNMVQDDIVQPFMGNVGNSVLTPSGSPQRSSQSVQVTNPLPGDILNQNLVLLEANVSDPCNGIHQVIFSIYYDGQWHSISAYDTGGDTWAVYWDASQVTDQVIKVKAFAGDFAGNGVESTVNDNISLLRKAMLTVNKVGTGSGTVTSKPAGINCGSDCSEAYSFDTVVTLTASPATGSTFTGWSGGGCSGRGNCILGMTESKNITASFEQQTFADVPPSYPYFHDIEILYANGLTGGCAINPLKFCADQIMNRGQAAAFMLRGNFGQSYVPPVPTHIFKDDWTKGPWAEGWAEGMRNEGFSAGCLANPLKYCPWDQIPREQAVIFALKLKNGKLYTPPPATGTLFADMTNPSFYATAWAEQAYKDGLIPNCGMSGGKPKFCPKELVSRGLAAYMIVRAKNLSMPSGMILR
jgi:hypothetical protein